MSNNLEVFENDGFVTAKLTGVRRPETLLAAATETTAYCREMGVLHLLIDIREMTGGLDTIETFEVAGHGIPSQTNARRLIRSAILDHPENLERIRFFETVAINRGFVVKIFDDEEKAVRWLSVDQSETRG